MMPIIPHFSNECLSLLNINTNIKWPNIDRNLLIEEKINFVIQINGKKRGIVKASRNITQDDLISLIKENSEIQKHLLDKKNKKKIFVPNKLINIIL